MIDYDPKKYALSREDIVKFIIEPRRKFVEENNELKERALKGDDEAIEDLMCRLPPATTGP